MKEENQSTILSFIEACYLAKDVKQIVNTAQEFFGNPCALFDGGYILIARSGDDTIEDILWNGIVNDNFFPDELLNGFIQEGLITKDFRVIEPSFIPRLYDENRPGRVKKISIAIPDNDGEINGWFVVFKSRRDFRETDYELLNWISRILTPHLETSVYERVNSPGMIGSVVLDILNNVITDHNTAQRRLNSLGWFFSGKCRILAIRHESGLVSHPVQKYLVQFFKQNHCQVSDFVLNGTFFLLLSQKEDLFSDEHFQEIYRVMSRVALFAGTSTPFDDLRDLKACYSQANECLRIGMKMHPENRVFLFEDYRTDIFMHEAARHFEISAFCHPCLLKLQEYDAENNTDYLNTLKHYIMNGGNLLAASRKLHIHRNTMEYRIEKIKAITSIDVNDRSIYADLAISFKILSVVK